MLKFVLLGGPPPPAPYPFCGKDPTVDRLGCQGSAACPDVETELPPSLDDDFLKITEAVPEFGGAYFGEDGFLNVVLTENSERIQEAALSMLFEIFGEGRFNKSRVRFVQGNYNFSELNLVRTAASNLFSDPLVTMLDVDETKNVVVVGVESMKDAEDLQALIATLPVPAESIVVEEHDSTPLNAPDNTDRVRPLRGGLQIAVGGTCTLGFVAERQGVFGFVTNSHCTGLPGNNGTVMFQPSMSVGNQIGIESVDPAFFTAAQFPFCPPGAVCRFSDSSFVALDSAVPTYRGQIARLAQSGFETYRINSTSSNPLFGEVLKKVGRSNRQT